MSAKPTIVFVFPGVAEHVEPTLPVCRGIVRHGISLEYVCEASFKDVIEETGAVFCDVDGVCALNGVSSFQDLLQNCLDFYGENGGPASVYRDFGSIATEALTRVFMDFFRCISPKVVVYCPIRCPFAHFAARALKIKAVSLLTRPGPGFVNQQLKQWAETPADVTEKLRSNVANLKAIENLRSLLGKRFFLTTEPLGNEHYTSLNLVATLQSLADPLSEKDACVYFAQGKKFEFLGPLRDPPEGECSQELLEKIYEAILTKSDIIYVSLGPRITSDDPRDGWNGCFGDHLLTGKQICHAIYRVILRESAKQVGPQPLLILDAGQQVDALPDELPENCYVLSARLPAPKVLEAARPSLFVTHGEGSLIEALAVASPMMILPSCAADSANAKLVAALGAAVSVEVPSMPSYTSIEAPLQVFEAAISDALDQILGSRRRAFRWQAQALSDEIRDAGGADRAVELITEAIPRSKRQTLQSRLCE